MDHMQELWFVYVKKKVFINVKDYEIMMKLANGTPEQKEMAQDALNRWWWPSLNDVRSNR